MIRFIASYLIWIMFLGVFFIFLTKKKKRKKLLTIFFITVLIWAISEMIKAMIPSSRPFLINGRGIKTMSLHFDSSFPSTHSALAFGLAMSVYYMDKSVGKIYLIAALLVGLGRYLANVHYIGDVFAGAALGITVSFLVNKYKFLKI